MIEPSQAEAIRQIQVASLPPGELTGLSFDSAIMWARFWECRHQPKKDPDLSRFLRGCLAGIQIGIGQHIDKYRALRNHGAAGWPPQVLGHYKYQGLDIVAQFRADLDLLAAGIKNDACMCRLIVERLEELEGER